MVESQDYIPIRDNYKQTKKRFLDQLNNTKKIFEKSTNDENRVCLKKTIDNLVLRLDGLKQPKTEHGEAVCSDCDCISLKNLGEKYKCEICGKEYDFVLNIIQKSL